MFRRVKSSEMVERKSTMIPTVSPAALSEGADMGQLKQQLWGHKFHSNEEVEFSFREWLRI